MEEMDLVGLHVNEVGVLVAGVKDMFDTEDELGKEMGDDDLEEQLAEQRRADQVTEELMNKEMEDEYNSMPAMTVADILDSEERKNLEMEKGDDEKVEEEENVDVVRGVSEVEP